MTGIELASWSFPVLLALIFIRVPIGLAMAVCGLVGAYFIYGSHGLYAVSCGTRRPYPTGATALNG